MQTKMTLHLQRIIINHQLCPPCLTTAIIRDFTFISFRKYVDRSVHNSKWRRNS